jgi:hypothetical protein
MMTPRSSSKIPGGIVVDSLDRTSVLTPDSSHTSHNRDSYACIAIKQPTSSILIMPRPHNLPPMHSSHTPKQNKRPRRKQHRRHHRASPQNPLTPNRIPNPYRRDRKAHIREHKTPPTKMELLVRHACDDGHHGRCEKPEAESPEEHSGAHGCDPDACR